ncbi:conserved unknown protein [Ectocarpus siliculosus]|uniref:Kinesin-like protein n=1 Tax=Ectocarpus siliculosus TaxID=2880 RepID=D8LIZ3_ECTSI|nr:conserved unknown protein [Ectocarpus siliculosus]|eukprot:CBN76877.1 conserved unknown protein [Ectocarpus siliculosus]
MGKTTAEGGDGGNSSHIRTFLRIRPSKRPSGYIKVDEFDKTRLGFHVPVETKDGEYVNNTRTSHKFKFDGVLGEKATQEDVFAKIGKGAVSNVLNGYNSTVFAYGQTGSGKTFTVTGGAERYVDRGIIPRALSLIFAEFKERSDQQFTCHISYLEIYNEQGFDLLDPSHDSKKLEDLAKVALMEDEDGNIHLRNLSVYLAANEEEALNYLFLGDTNRAISETAMNKASSRSHCIFTISVEGRKHGSDKVMRSKLHLVDLAGSERVHKTQTGGQTLVEAKHINVSLFFLEMVIVALRERGAKGRQHIPYRNSMMTSVLRDSLGGNCKTVMIATVNAEAAQTEESISTCRFAQRVSTIKNDARVNEDVDPGVLIRRLRSDNATLSDEVAFLKGETGDGEELTSEEAEDLKDRCRAFVEDPAPSAQLSIGAYTLTKLKRCFSVFKAMVLDGGRALSTGGAHSQGHDMVGEGGPAGAMTKLGEGSTGELGGQLLSLRDALRQRDNEIAILVNMLKQGKCHACAAAPSSATPGATTGGGLPPNRQHDPGGENASPQHHNRRSPLPGAAAVGAATGASGGKLLANGEGAGRVVVAPKGTVGGRDAGGRHRGGSVSGVERPSDASVLGDPQRAFGYFRERHSGRVALEENKKLLGEKYARAKAMGERVNQARSTIQYLKNTIEQVRRERALDGLMEEGSVGGSKGDDEDRNSRPQVGLGEEEDEEETKCKAAIEVEKRVYKGSFQELRELKSEIEHIQRLLEKGRSKMQADFQAWYEPLACSVEEEDGAVASEGNCALGEGGTKPKAQSFGGGDDKPRGAHHHAPQGHRQAVVGKTTRERQSEEPAAFDGSGKDGANTPTRRPRPPVDAWGTPPDSTSRRRGPLSSVATGSVSGGDGGGSKTESAPTSGGGRGAWHGGAGGGGLLPPLTGNKEADDDIAAFYRAKEELERRKSAAGRNSGGR